MARSSRQALKEWAVVVAALEQGDQILLLRKGGIHEPRGQFKAAHREFFLFPGWEHQKEELLKPEAVARYGRWLDPEAEKGPVRVDVFARLEESIQLGEPEKAKRLACHHIWSEAYVQMRIDYKPEAPLHVLLLRVFVLPATVEIPRHPRYAGCRSWLELEEELSTAGARAVLEEEELARRIQGVRDLLK